MKTSAPIRMLALSVSLFLLGACSDALLTAHKRDAAFYTRLTNPAAEYPRAAEKLDQLKLLDSGDTYPMRVALFDNQRFYYQIDKLGEGTGEWEYRDGAIFLVAARPYFDLLIVVSAESAQGEGTVVRFEDRHGLNTVKIGLRDPTLGRTVKPLKTYRYSDKNI